MANELTITASALAEKGIDVATWSALKNSIYPGAKDESVMMALDYCRARQLDPLLKPVHLVPMSVKDSRTGKSEWRDVVMPGTGSEIAEKFGVTLIEFNRVANGITRGAGQIAQIVESEKWLNEDGICDRTFELATKPKDITPQGKSRLFTRRAIEQSQEGRRQECIARAARRSRLIAQGLYIDEMESVL